MNWGHKITIAIVAFMSFILYMVVQASMRSVDLEADNYYQQEIQYQDRVDAMTNAKGMEEQFIITQKSNELVVEYPAEVRLDEIKGQLHFFKPDNSSLDKVVKIDIDAKGTQSIPLSELSKGVYVLKANWTATGKDYYIEKALNIK